MPVFSIDDVHWFLDQTENLGIDVWLDGGWGVDALIGRQTRSHEDLDIAVQTFSSAPLRQALEAQGFGVADTADRRWFNFVYAHPDERRIDFHLFDIDGEGNGLYGDSGAIYPAEGLLGTGRIDGRTVRCIGASTAVRFHTGYLHDENDAHDVRLLCETFGLELPDQYR
jgi:lincosamide nucleotidyltransferase A/C/D/E